MNAIRTLAAALAITAGAIAGAGAQQAPQQGSSSGATAAPSGIGAGGMMGYPGMGPGMMGSGAGMMGYGAGMMGYGGMGMAWGRPMCVAMAGHIEGRLAYLKAELKITDAQEALWNSYAAAARDNANAVLAHCTAMMAERGAAAGLPDRLERHAQLMAARLDALRAVNKALKPLYAAFSDRQKETADQLFWGPMSMM